MAVKGETINYLTMVSNPIKEGKRKFAIFRCHCGKEKKIRIDQVTSGNTKSCGCMQKALHNYSRLNYRHGERNTRLYNIFHKMQERCYNPNYAERQYYSDRGITVCDEWKGNYVAFRNWSLNNGYANNLSIDRIDVNKGYSPDNCRWVDAKVQSRNRRNNLLVTMNGETKILMEWCEELGLPYGTVLMRIHRGWDSVDALTKPIKRIKGGYL